MAWRGVFCDQLKQIAMKWMVQIAIVLLMSWLVFIAFGFNQRQGILMRSGKADRDEMDGADSDGFIDELAGIHRLWFQPKARYFDAIR